MNKSLAADLEKLQKRLEIYEDRVLAAQPGDDTSYFKTMVEYYRAEATRVRDALLNFSTATATELKGR